MSENQSSLPMVPEASTQLAIERTYIAHERTLMAWVRTSVSLITFGFSIQQFFRTRGATEVERLIGPREVGLVMMIVGLLAIVVAIAQNRWDVQQLQSRYPTQQGYVELPRSRARLIALLVALLGINGLVAMLVWS